MRVVCEVEQNDGEEKPPTFGVNFEDDVAVVVCAADVATATDAVAVADGQHFVVFVDRLDAAAAVVSLGHDRVGDADFRLDFFLMSRSEKCLFFCNPSVTSTVPNHFVVSYSLSCQELIDL